MDIKRPQDKRVIFTSGSQSVLKHALLILLFIAYTAITLIGGAVAHKTGEMSAWYSRIKSIPHGVRQLVALYRSNPKHIRIDVKHKHFEKLAAQRRRALAKGFLIVGEDDYVPATIRLKDKSVLVKLRLKGDWTTHLTGDKWSFRIRVKGNEAIFGMKQFSIHHPKLRNYIYEWIFHQALKREGVVALRYEFIRVTLNGKDLGIYALEEHFEKGLLQDNGRREGPIIRFSEDLFWKEYVRLMAYPSGSYLASPVDAFHTKRILSNASMYSQFLRSISLLEGFRSGQLRTSDVFDMDKMARFFAITDLMGAEHGAKWHNTRFYYNPITSRLEPIGFDGNAGQRITSLTTLSHENDIYVGYGSPPLDNYYGTLFGDPIFFREYVKNLERIADPAYLHRLLEELENDREENLAIIHREFPYIEFSKEILYANQKYIKNIFNPVKALHAYYANHSTHDVEIRLGNIQSMPVEIIGLVLKDRVTVEPAKTVLLPGKRLSRPVQYKTVRFQMSAHTRFPDPAAHDIKVRYRLLGTKRIRHASVFPWGHLDLGDQGRNFMKAQGNAERFSFLVIDRARKQIFIKPGRWKLTEDMILPKGFTVFAGGGIQLDLSNSAKIISYATLHLRGSQQEPILIYSGDSSGQGLVLMNAHERSVLSHVIFRNLSPPLENGWKLTGAVTVYESSVDIRRCHFTQNRAEDALNIIRSEFTISESSFVGNMADALDVDFSVGSIASSSFLDSGNDAIDLSGSVASVEDVYIQKASDKGISVGENSQLRLVNVDIRDVKVGIAAKDMSEVEGKELLISNSAVAIAAYQKKPEFGPARIRVNGVKFTQVVTDYLIEEKSFALSDGNVIAAKERDVALAVDGQGGDEGRAEKKQALLRRNSIWHNQ